MKLQLLALAGALTAPAFAQTADVAIVAAASGSLTDCRYTDVQSYLLATGQFASVDIIDCVTQTPTLGDLAPYDAVLSWSNTNFDDSVALGDVMADYHDQGGAVVIAVFGTTSTSAARSLDGRWRSGGYELIETAGGNVGGSASLGTILNAAHPTVAGVTALSASSAFRPQATTPILQGTVIAEWSDGAPLIVTDAPLGGRVDLGLYPPSGACSSTFWDVTGDGDDIVANALTHAIATAGGSGSLGTNYCTAVANSSGAAGSMSASGSSIASNNDLTLIASSLPVGQFGIFLTSQTSAQVPAGNGNLCLGGSIGRYTQPSQIRQADMNGEFQLSLDLTQTPQGVGFVSVGAGETWYFAAWFRDTTAGNAGYNFTDGLQIDFN